MLKKTIKGENVKSVLSKKKMNAVKAGWACMGDGVLVDCTTGSKNFDAKFDAFIWDWEALSELEE